ncbi:S9 family peptidase [Kibdelosporangium persicum]|uniref:Secreted protein n=1 Tax=Kibdelosporangium persicum TaxID=2698649 RepID=A0ABX2FFW9_9PSEU|nr:hypothetical protein [Kibdelosporangium persicum]NRN69770.1 hypothetical protein [Kibdelosporangium persicum]
MRLLRLTLPVLVVAALATPAHAAQPQTGPPQAPSGWSVSGTQLVWRSAEPVPVGDAAIEFWSGDHLLGRPRPSADHRTFTLTAPTVVNPHDLSVRAAGRRLDVAEQPQPMKSPLPPAPPAFPAGTVDPGTPGPFGTTRGEYTVDSITLPDYPRAIEMQAVVVAPTNAPGKRPLALFLHGRHSTCYDPTNEDQILLDWPCPAGTKPVPSHRGYLQAQQLLASQGYVTVSISANGINAQDGDTVDQGAQGRSSLVRQHLTRWADWAGAGRDSAPDIVRAAPITDMSNVFLMGHSRGGEGVNRAAMDSISPPPGDKLPARWTVRGTLLIGPTIFGHNPAPDVPSATILPGCDGDVSDLQGQMFIDATRGVSRGAALHSALYFVGANHNFFNTEWTPGQSEAPSWDDFGAPGDAVCSPGAPTRLTATQQQTAGATYIAAAARLFVGGDQRVLPLLDGTGVRAPSADPARVVTHAVGGARTSFVVPESSTKVSGDGRLCRQTARDADACAEPLDNSRFAHFVRLWGVDDPDRFSVALSGTAEVRPANAVSLAGSRNLAVRLVVPPNTTGAKVDIAITDTQGRKADLGSATLDGLPATQYRTAFVAQEVRVPLPWHGIDLHQVASLEIRSSGQAWLMDAYGWNNGLPDPRPVPLSRVDVGMLSVQEGDSGTKTYQVPVKLTGNSPGTARLFIPQAAGGYSTRVITVQPGQHTVEIPFDVVGNTRWSWGSSRQMFAKALTGVVAGGYIGGLTIVEDDPEPVLTVTPATVTEGGELKWTMTASAVADSPIIRSGELIKAQDPELSTTDVDPKWLKDRTGQDPLPARPLSQVGVWLSAQIQPGSLTAELSIPTVTDTEAEPAEHVRAVLSSYPPGGADVEIAGSVTD